MGFVAGPSLGILERHLKVARERGFVTYREVLAEFLRDGEEAARYAALADWYASRGHFWVGNGPFYLHSVHPVERTVVVRHFDAFPIRPTSGCASRGRRSPISTSTALWWWKPGKAPSSI